MDVSRRASYASLAAILLLATLIQAILLARLPTISADGIIFIGIARDLAQTPIETMRAQDQHPGYPAMLLACTRVVRWLGYGAQPESWMAGGVLVSFVCGLLSVAVVWFFARDLFDARLASAAAIIFTVLPVPRTSAVDAQSDTPHVLFYLLAAWMATTGMTSGSLWRLAAAGAASGVAFWIRPEGLEVALLALPFLIWHAMRADWSWPRRIAAVGTLATTALLVVAPYPILTGKLTSKQLPSAKAQIAQIAKELASSDAAPSPQPVIGSPQPVAVQEAPDAAGQTPPSPNESPAAASSRAASESLPAPPPAVVDATPQSKPVVRRYSVAGVTSKLSEALSAFINSICQGLKFVFIPAYLLSIVALAWRRPPGIQVAFLAVLGTTHIAILMGLHVHAGYIAHRHVIPLVALAAPFVALGLWQASEWMALLLKARSSYWLAAALGICCAAVLPYTLRQLNGEFVPVIEATRWIQSRAGPDSGIICNSPYVGFYGNLPVAQLSPTTPTLEAAMAKAPAQAQYDYALLHVGAHAYRAEWLGQLERHYRPVLELPVINPKGGPARVLVLRARRPGVRHATRQPR